MNRISITIDDCCFLTGKTLLSGMPSTDLGVICLCVGSSIGCVGEGYMGHMTYFSDIHPLHLF
jgi:hypothetical protein